jgi:hypothetical protein
MGYDLRDVRNRDASRNGGGNNNWGSGGSKKNFFAGKHKEFLEKIFTNLAVGLCIAFFVHFLIVLFISATLSDLVENLSGGEHWWFSGIGFFGYGILLAASTWIATTWYKSIFSKVAFKNIMIVFAVLCLLNIFAGYSNRNMSIENKNLCFDNPQFPPYIWGGKYCKDRKSFKSLSIADHNLFDTAIAISNGTKPSRIEYTNPDDLRKIILNEGGIQKVFRSKKYYKDPNLNNAEVYVFYFGAGIGNMGTVSDPDFLIPAIQTEMDYNIKLWSEYTKELERKMKAKAEEEERKKQAQLLGAQKLRLEESERLQNQQSVASKNTSRNANSSSGGGGTVGVILALMIVAFLMFR